MCIRVVNLKQNKLEVKNDAGIESNLTYKVLFLIANTSNGITRNQVKKHFPTAWVILRRAITKGWIVRKFDGKYYKYIITENGLDKIALIEIDYNIYEG